MVNKPAGLVVHPDASGSPDLISALSAQLQMDSSLQAKTQWNREAELSVAHRLDREVSGVVLVSCDVRVRSLVQKQFQAKTVSKVYHAIVRGAPADDEGLWRKTMTKKAEVEATQRDTPRCVFPPKRVTRCSVETINTAYWN